MADVDDFLEHYGVKGMKWGIRNDDRGGVSRKTDRTAKKDAKEFARAKLYYGEGAGNRRKLIKATVEARKKKDPAYASAFERHLSEQDLSKHADKARKERKSTDRKTRTKQQAGYVARRFTGEMGTQAAFLAVAAAGAAYASSPKARAFAKNKYSMIKDHIKRKRGAAYLNDYFKKYSV